MKTLYLPLKKQWYEMIERGEKREEYRECKQSTGSVNSTGQNVL